MNYQKASLLLSKALWTRPYSLTSDQRENWISVPTHHLGQELLYSAHTAQLCLEALRVPVIPPHYKTQQLRQLREVF